MPQWVTQLELINCKQHTYSGLNEISIFAYLVRGFGWFCVLFEGKSPMQKCLNHMLYFNNITYAWALSTLSRQTIRPRTNSFFEIWIIYLRLGFGVFGFLARDDFWGGIVTDSTRGLVDWSLILSICILVWPKYLRSSSLSKQRFSCTCFKISNHGI